MWIDLIYFRRFGSLLVAWILLLSSSRPSDERVAVISLVFLLVTRLLYAIPEGLAKCYEAPSANEYFLQIGCPCALHAIMVERSWIATSVVVDVLLFAPIPTLLLWGALRAAIGWCTALLLWALLASLPSLGSRVYWQFRYLGGHCCGGCELLDEEWFCSSEEAVEVALQGDDLQRFNQALVLGAGTSRLPETLAPRCDRVIASDITPVAAPCCSKPSHPSLSYAVEDALSLSFPDASFDLVIEKGTFAAISAGDGGGTEILGRCIAESARVLRPGGILCSIHLTGGTKHASLMEEAGLVVERSVSVNAVEGEGRKVRWENDTIGEYRGCLLILQSSATIARKKMIAAAQSLT